MPAKLRALASGAEAAVGAGPEMFVRITNMTASADGLRPGEQLHHVRAFDPATLMDDLRRFNDARCGYACPSITQMAALPSRLRLSERLGGPVRSPTPNGWFTTTFQCHILHLQQNRRSNGVANAIVMVVRVVGTMIRQARAVAIA